jgi:O-antigen ligase
MLEGNSRPYLNSLARELDEKALLSSLGWSLALVVLFFVAWATVLFQTAAVFAAVCLSAGFLWGLLGIFRPRLLLGLVLLASATTGGIRDLGQLSIGRLTISLFGLITALITAGSILTLVAHRKYIRRRWFLDFRAFWVFGALALVRTFGSSAGPEGWRQAFLILVSLFIPLVARLALSQDPASLHWIERVFVRSAIATIVILLGTSALGYMQASSEGFISIFGRRNVALYLMLVLAFGLAHWRYSDTLRRQRVGLYVSAAALLIILTSLSRTTSAIALLFLVPLRFAEAHGRKAWLSLLATPILAVTLLGFLLLWGPMRARFLGEGVGLAAAGDLQSDYADLNTEGRNEMWAATYLNALQKPLLGNGTGTASELIQIVVPGLEHPHNDYLRVFHDHGLIGLGLFLWAWWGRVRYHWKTWRSSETVPPIVYKYRLIGLSVAISVSLSFLTDNLMLYEYMMMPSLLLFSMSDFLETEFPANSGGYGR